MAHPPLRPGLSEVCWLSERDASSRCAIRSLARELYGSLGGLGSKPCAVIEAGSPRGSALIANKVYLLLTTAPPAQRLTPRLPSLCGPIMKVRATVYT